MKDKGSMRVLINASTLQSTGVVQVAVSFIEECKKFDENQYFVFLSPLVKKELKDKHFPGNFYFEEILLSPNKILQGRPSRKYLKKRESEINPDFVLSVFGPAYWRPKSPHIQGFAFGHYVYPDSPFFKDHYISFFERLKWNVRKRIHGYFLNRDGKFFICETDDVSSRLPNFIKVAREKVFTVSNVYNDVFNLGMSNKQLLPIKLKREFRILCLCSGDKHKNLTILNSVIPILRDKYKQIDFKFVLTVDNIVFERLLENNVRTSVYNVGRVSIEDCPNLYRESDCLFLPSLIECFSANYPEAMVMRIPIVTSNLSFARDICGDAASYVNPLDADQIAERLYQVASSVDLRTKLVEEGDKQLMKFGSAQERAKKYLEIGRSIRN